MMESGDCMVGGYVTPQPWDRLRGENTPGLPWAGWELYVGLDFTLVTGLGVSAKDLGDVDIWYWQALPMVEPGDEGNERPGFMRWALLGRFKPTDFDWVVEQLKPHWETFYLRAVERGLVLS